MFIDREDATEISSTGMHYDCQHNFCCATDLSAMSDRHRFNRRASELRAFADRMGPLAKMPDRATSADIQLAADLATKAANDLDELASATPAGCICRRIENDNYSYLDYVESCIHHRQYYLLREKLKEDYAKMEKALKDEARMKIVAAVLTGAALLPDLSDNREHTANSGLAKHAIEIADETIRQIMETV